MTRFYSDVEVTFYEKENKYRLMQLFRGFWIQQIYWNFLDCSRDCTQLVQIVEFVRQSDTLGMIICWLVAVKWTNWNKQKHQYIIESVLILKIIFLENYSLTSTILLFLFVTTTETITCINSLIQTYLKKLSRTLTKQSWHIWLFFKISHVLHFVSCLPK